jgi:hypothetical protein
MNFGPWQPLGGTTRTGEIAGMHTVAELADMMQVTLYESGQMNDAVGACTAWLRADPQGFSDFSGRVSENSLDLAHLLAAAKSVVDNTPTFLRSVTPIAGSQYDDLLAWRKRFQALDQELRANPHGCTPPEYPQMPQPEAADPDLHILHGTQAVTQPIDQGVAAARSAAESGIATARALAESRMPFVLLGVLGTVTLIAFARRQS